MERGGWLQSYKCNIPTSFLFAGCRASGYCWNFTMSSLVESHPAAVALLFATVFLPMNPSEIFMTPSGTCLSCQAGCFNVVLEGGGDLRLFRFEGGMNGRLKSKFHPEWISLSRWSTDDGMSIFPHRQLGACLPISVIRCFSEVYVWTQSSASTSKKRKRWWKKKKRKRWTLSNCHPPLGKSSTSEKGKDLNTEMLFPLFCVRKCFSL